jgi:hypothetical protein
MWIAGGSSRHGDPVRSTQSMPFRQARSEQRGRPVFCCWSSLVPNEDRTSSRCSSVTSPAHATPTAFLSRGSTGAECRRGNPSRWLRLVTLSSPVGARVVWVRACWARSSEGHRGLHTKPELGAVEAAIDPRRRLPVAHSCGSRRDCPRSQRVAAARGSRTALLDTPPQAEDAKPVSPTDFARDAGSRYDAAAASSAGPPAVYHGESYLLPAPDYRSVLLVGEMPQLTQELFRRCRGRSRRVVLPHPARCLRVTILGRQPSSRPASRKDPWPAARQRESPPHGPLRRH